MSIADKITSIENHLKDDYQSIANLGADLTNVDKNIENISSLLDGVYDVLPKTEFQEGTEVTIEGGLKGKLDFEDGIVGIGDTSQYTTTGKQLIPLNEADFTTTYYGQNVEIKNQTIKINGSASDIYSISVGKNGLVAPTSTDRITFEVNSGTYKYTQFATGTAYSGIKVRLKDENTGTMYVSESTITLTETHTFSVNIFIEDTNNKNAEIKIQLESGTTAHNWEPYTNGASPNPSYPQEVEVVRGKNRWGGFTPFSKTMGTLSLTQNKDGSITLNGTASVISSSVTIQEAIDNNIYITLEKGTYTVSGGGNNYVIQIYDTSSNALATISSGQTSVTFTITERKNVICRVFIDSSGTNYNNVNVKLQLEKGSQATSYLPYNTVEVKIENKNLISGVEFGKYSDVTGVKLDDNSLYRNTEFISIKPSTTYTFSINGTTQGINKFYYDKNKNFINKASDVNATFTTPNNAYYLNVYRGTSLGNTGWQLEEGSSATTYEPYHTPITYQISLGSNKFYKIGDYADELLYDVDEDKVYKNEKVGKIVLDGSSDENWQMDYSTGFVSNRFTCDNLPSLDVTSQTNFNYGYCNIGKITSEAYYSTYLNVVKLRYINNQSRVDCMFDIESLNAFKTLLAQTPMEIYYQRLGGAELTEITDTTLKQQVKNWYYSHSLNGTTIIESNGDLPMIIKVRALKGE